MISKQTIEPNAPVFVAVGQFCLQQIRQIERQIEKLRKPDADHDQAEAIHDLRVAVRKSQSLALAFAPYIPGKWPERIRHELRPLRKTCEALRDLDVLVEWIEAARPPSIDLHPLLADLQRQQAEAIEEVLNSLLDKQNLSLLKRLRSKLELALDDVQNTDASAIPLVQPHYRLADVAVSALLTRAADLTAWRATLLQGPGTAQPSPASRQDSPQDSRQDSRAEVLHQLRIASKHFRYTLDFLTPAIPAINPALSQAFAEIQTVLGDLHDRMQFRTRLLAWPDHRTLLPVYANQLVARLEREEDALSQRLAPLLDQLTPAWFQANLLRPCPSPDHKPV